jgi:hypothetical protein
MTLTREQIARIRMVFAALIGSQEQCDEDGTMIAVSRQAVCELQADMPALLDIAEAVANAPVGVVGAVELEHAEYCSEIWTTENVVHMAGQSVAILPLAGEVGK